MTTNEDTTATVPAPMAASKVKLIGDLTMTVVALVIFVGGYLVARDWPFGARLFPEAVTISGALLSAVLLIFLVVRTVRGTNVAPTAPDPATEPANQLEISESNLMSEAEEEDFELDYAFANATGAQWGAALGWIALYFAGIWVVGAIITTLFVTFAYLKIAGRQSFLVAILYAAVLVGIMWASQEYVQVKFPQGLLFGEGS